MKTKKVNLMALVSVFVIALMICAVAFIPSFAKESSAISGLVSWAGSICAGLVAIFLMVSIAKDAVGYAKGSGQTSVIKIIGKVIFMVIMIAVIVLAQSYDKGKIKSVGENLANTGLDTIDNAVTDSEIGGSSSSSGDKGN